MVIMLLRYLPMYRNERPRPRTNAAFAVVAITILFFAFAVVLAPLAFLKHPAPDVGGTVQHRNSRRLARIQKANRLDISEGHFL